MSKKEKLAATDDLEQKGDAAAPIEETPALATADSEGTAQAAPDVAEVEAESVEGTLVVVAPPVGIKALNVRSGPGLQYAVLGVLQEGTMATVLDLPMGMEVPGWAPVFVSSDLIGWVDCRYILEVEE